MRRGLSFIELLLTGTVVAVAVIVAAYIFLPDVQRGVRLIAHDVEARWFGG